MPQENQDEQINDFGVPVGVELTFEQVRQMQRNIEARARDATDNATGTSDESTTKLTVPEIKAKLTELGVEIPEGAKKADLVALLDEALKPKE